MYRSILKGFKKLSSLNNKSYSILNTEHDCCYVEGFRVKLDHLHLRNIFLLSPFSYFLRPSDIYFSPKYPGSGGGLWWLKKRFWENGKREWIKKKIAIKTGWNFKKQNIFGLLSHSKNIILHHFRIFIFSLFEDTEVLMLATNMIRKDLSSTSQYEEGLPNTMNVF